MVLSTIHEAPCGSFVHRRCRLFYRVAFPVSMDAIRQFCLRRPCEPFTPAKGLRQLLYQLLHPSELRSPGSLAGQELGNFRIHLSKAFGF